MSNQEVRIYISNISEDVEFPQMRDLVRKFGFVKDIIYQRNNHHAYVQYGNHEGAEKALEELNNQDLNGQDLKVEWADDERCKNIKFKDRSNGDERKCFKCQQSGHMARDCTQEGDDGRRDFRRNDDRGRDNYDRNDRGDRNGRSFRDRDDRDGGNFRGGDRGNFRGNDRGGDRGGDRGEKKCFNCQGFGHMARECTQERKPRDNYGDRRNGDRYEQRNSRDDRKCYKCQGFGHMARDCTEQGDSFGRERKIQKNRDDNRGGYRNRDEHRGSRNEQPQTRSQWKKNESVSSSISSRTQRSCSSKKSDKNKKNTKQSSVSPSRSSRSFSSQSSKKNKPSPQKDLKQKVKTMASKQWKNRNQKNDEIPSSSH